MAGVGSIGSRVALSKSSLHSPKRKGKKPVSSSRERLCRSIESLQSDQSEHNRLFPPRRQPTLDLGNYGTLKQISEYKEANTGLLDFMVRTIDLLLSSVVVKILFLVLSAFPVSMLVVGSTYRLDCPREPKLPLYLLVGGGFGLLKILFLFWRNRKLEDYEPLDDNDYDDDDDNEDVVLARFVRFTNIILNVFLLVWFVCGNYWFYSIWKPNFSQVLHEPRNWCHQNLYWYCFYSLIISYVLGFILIIVLLTIVFYYTKCCNLPCYKHISGVV